eukprot:scaffold4342_cov166-Ochromonas_danica.AAC.4
MEEFDPQLWIRGAAGGGGGGGGRRAVGGGGGGGCIKCIGRINPTKKNKTNKIRRQKAKQSTSHYGALLACLAPRLVGLQVVELHGVDRAPPTTHRHTHRHTVIERGWRRRRRQALPSLAYESDGRDGVEAVLDQRDGHEDGRAAQPRHAVDGNAGAILASLPVEG